MVNPIYPTRSFIRFQAKSQLTADMIGQQVMTFINREANEHHIDAAMPSQSHGPSVPDADVHKQLNAANILDEGLDERLLKEIATLTFHPDQHPEIYQPCDSREHATAIEQAIAAEIVATYKRIKENESRANVKALNALL